MHQKMRTATEGSRKVAPPTETVSEGIGSEQMAKLVATWLDEAKAEKIVTIDLKGKSTIADFMIIATGRSDRHVGSCADVLRKRLKEEAGVGSVRVEGLETCDWALIDAGDVVVHVFRAEVREFYNLEKMWSASHPGEQISH